MRERIVHDLSESEKRCQECGKDLRLMGEDKSERYEYIPATMKVIEDVRLRYACACTVKAAEKPAQPIEKSTAGASLLAQVVVSKFCDHQPLHRQEQMFARHGVEISRQTMCGWMASVADLAMPLYETALPRIRSTVSPSCCRTTGRRWWRVKPDSAREGAFSHSPMMPGVGTRLEVRFTGRLQSLQAQRWHPSPISDNGLPSNRSVGTGSRWASTPDAIPRGGWPSLRGRPSCRFLLEMPA